MLHCDYALNSVTSVSCVLAMPHCWSRGLTVHLTNRKSCHCQQKQTSRAGEEGSRGLSAPPARQTSTSTIWPGKIWKNLEKYTQIYPNIPKYTQIYPNIPKYTQLYPTIPNYTQLYPTIPNYTQLYTNIHKLEIQEEEEETLYSTVQYSVHYSTIQYSIVTKDWRVKKTNLQ